MTSETETHNNGNTRGGRRRPSARQNTPRTLALRQRQAEAVRLRIAGSSYEQIAHQLGYANRAGAFKAVDAARRDLVREPAEELVALEAERLDALQRMASDVLAEARAGGNDLLVLRCLDALLRVSESRRRLFGLDAPARHDVVAGDGAAVTVVFHPDLAPGQPR